MLCRLYCGCTRHLAPATMPICRGPVIPVGEIRHCRLGVRRNGTGRFASNSPGEKIELEDYYIIEICSVKVVTSELILLLIVGL